VPEGVLKILSARSVLGYILAIHFALVADPALCLFLPCPAFTVWLTMAWRCMGLSRVSISAYCLGVGGLEESSMAVDLVVWSYSWCCQWNFVYLTWVSAAACLLARSFFPLRLPHCVIPLPSSPLIPLALAAWSRAKACPGGSPMRVSVLNQ
jgi:hypothetical protein